MVNADVAWSGTKPGGPRPAGVVLPPFRGRPAVVPSNQRENRRMSGSGGCRTMKLYNDEVKAAYSTIIENLDNLLETARSDLKWRRILRDDVGVRFCKEDIRGLIGIRIAVVKLRDA